MDFEDMDFSEVSPKPTPPSDMSETREEFIMREQKRGNKVVYPKGHELQIDLDSEKQYEVFLVRFGDFAVEMARRGYTVERKEAPSRSGLPKRHITITVYGSKRFTHAERIAWQAALGSDWKRELLSMFRVLDGDRHPTLFLEGGPK